MVPRPRPATLGPARDPHPRHPGAAPDQAYRAIFDEADTPAVLLNLHARILDVNGACVSGTGHERGDLLGRFVGKIMTRRDVAVYESYWMGMVAGRRDRYELPGALRRADGQLRPSRLVTRLVRDLAGRPALAVACALPPGATIRSLPPARLPTIGEAAVLEGLAGGSSIQEIADGLGLTRRGVDYRIARLRHKLRTDGVDPVRSPALIARAYLLGVLDLSAWPPQVRPDAIGGE